jgi:hypothetical protein
LLVKWIKMFVVAFISGAQSEGDGHIFIE